MKEFLLTDSDFKEVAHLVYNACGIVLGEHKREMVYSRLARRIRERKLTNFSSYLDYLKIIRIRSLMHLLMPLLPI